MTKRERVRLIKLALRHADCSPETYATRYPHLTGGASARTIRRWAEGVSTPNPLVLQAIARHITPKATTTSARSLLIEPPTTTEGAL